MLTQELTALLNTYSQENSSNTPDVILADYLLCCLAAFNMAINKRESWYGRDPAHPATRALPLGADPQP